MARQSLPHHPDAEHAFTTGWPQQAPFFLYLRPGRRPGRDLSENSLKETVTRLATPLVQAQGLEIWGVEIAQAGRTTVRVFVDLPLEVKQAQAALSADSDPADNLEDSADIMTARSASIDQCEEISRQLGLALEVEDLIEQAYVLEVSTPGFSRLFFSLDQMRS